MWTPTLLFLALLCAQEIPAQKDTEPAAPSRIVEGRPALYAFKHAIHPLTWLQDTTRPIARSAQEGLIHGVHMFAKRPAKPPIRFGVGGMGANSGFGPFVALFHDDLLGRGIDAEVSALYTYRGHETYQFTASAPIASEGSVERLSLDLMSAYRSRASVHFFGVGNDSPLQNKTKFRTVSREAGIGFTAQLDDAWSAGIHGLYRNIGITRPRAGASTQDFFDSDTAPGLFTGAKLASTELSLSHDTRDRAQASTKGGQQRLELSRNEGIGKSDFSYWKYIFAFQQYFALGRDRRKVIAVRGMVETNQERRGSVPFFDMPALGDWNTLRGFQNYRFRDKSAVTFGLEYRYRIWQALDWGIFVDRGQVGPQFGDFAWNRFHTGYGVKLIMLPKPDRPITFDVARSNEAWRFYINFSPKF